MGEIQENPTLQNHHCEKNFIKISMQRRKEFHGYSEREGRSVEIFKEKQNWICFFLLIILLSYVN